MSVAISQKKESKEMGVKKFFVRQIAIVKGIADNIGEIYACLRRRTNLSFTILAVRAGKTRITVAK